ncbi:MAG: glycosyltransferase family 39 protein, partial [Chloroflexota bacterium]
MRRVNDLIHKLSHSVPFGRWGIPFLIFLTAFVPRVIYPVSRPRQWFTRSLEFVDAILDLDPTGTFLRYHPGVSLMWLSGPAEKLAALLTSEVSLDQIYGEVPVTPGVLNTLTWAGVLPLVLVISLCTALTFPLISRLAGRRIALVSGLFLALSPYLLTYSRVIHVDALLAMFMIVSALFLLNYLKESTIHNLLLSGLFAGFAFLSKSPALFLIPYSGLVVTVAATGRIAELRAEHAKISWSREAGRVVGILLVWLGIGIVTYVALFPAMWVIPGRILADLYQSIFQHVSSPHKNLVYFADRIWSEADPGTPFYLAVIGWKTTAITLSMIVVALVIGVRRFRKPGTRFLWAMVAYAVFFTLQMGIG